VAPIEITTELVFNQPSTSGLQTADKLHAPNWPTPYNSASYNGQTGNHTYLSCRVRGSELGKKNRGMYSQLMQVFFIIELRVEKRPRSDRWHIVTRLHP